MTEETHARLFLDHFSKHAVGKTVHCLGNGPSRLGFEAPEGDVVIGCNAAYRDTRVDFLVIQDFTMAKEVFMKNKDWEGVLVLRNRLVASLLNKRRKVCPEGPRRAPDWVYTCEPPHLNTTGALITWYACQMGATNVVLHGYDGGGPDNNIYADSDHYPDSRRAPRWFDVLTSFQKVRDLHPHVEFSSPTETFMLNHSLVSDNDP